MTVLEHESDTVTMSREELRNFMHEEFSHFLADIEFRVAQAYDVAHDRQKAYAEDIVLNQFLITGYTLTNNSPTTGVSVAWASVVLVYNGTQYTITSGNSANKYIWFDAATSTTVLQSSNTKPTLSGNATLVFVNNAGIGVSVLESNSQGLPAATRNNAIDNLALTDNAVDGRTIADRAVTGIAISLTAGILGSQLSSTAGLVGTQLASNANLQSGQLSSTLGLTGNQVGTLANQHIGLGSIQARNTALFTHLIY